MKVCEQIERLKLLDPESEINDVLVAAESVILHYADKKSWRQYAARDVLYIGSTRGGRDVADDYLRAFPVEKEPCRGQWMS